MKKSVLKYMALLLLLAGSFTQAHAWPQPKGWGFFKLDFSAIRARKFYSMDGSIVNINGPGTLLGSYTTAFYGEYGLTNRLTAIGYVPFLVRNTVNQGVGAITGEVLQRGLENTAFGDVDLGLKYGLLKKGPWVLNTTLMLGLPTGDYQNEDLLYSGDGEANQLIRLDWGYGGRRWYATGFAGVNNRTKGFSEEFRYNAEAGVWLLPSKLLAIGRITGVESFNNGDPGNSGNGLFSNNVEYISPQVSLTYEMKRRWGITAQIAGAFKGRNALASPAISVGIYTKLKR